jgi:hypothetical protein
VSGGQANRKESVRYSRIKGKRTFIPKSVWIRSNFKRITNGILVESQTKLTLFTQSKDWLGASDFPGFAIPVATLLK